MPTWATPAAPSCSTCSPATCATGATQVRYVRNITDVGHLEGDADAGEDKLAKVAKAKLAAIGAHAGGPALH